MKQASVFRVCGTGHMESIGTKLEHFLIPYPFRRKISAPATSFLWVRGERAPSCGPCWTFCRAGTVMSVVLKQGSWGPVILRGVSWPLWASVSWCWSSGTVRWLRSLLLVQKLVVNYETQGLSSSYFVMKCSYLKLEQFMDFAGGNCLFGVFLLFCFTYMCVCEIG